MLLTLQYIENVIEGIYEGIMTIYVDKRVSYGLLSIY